jgi:nicotinamidase-related amidase
LLDELEIDHSDLIIGKTANDSFYSSDLLNKLQDLKITSIWVTGCATDFCVDATIKSALNHNFNVYIDARGHTTADRPSLKANQVIDHYNWMWQNMLPTEGHIKVIDA